MIFITYFCMCVCVHVYNSLLLTGLLNWLYITCCLILVVGGTVNEYTKTLNYMLCNLV